MPSSCPTHPRSLQGHPKQTVASIAFGWALCRLACVINFWEKGHPGCAKRCCRRKHLGSTVMCGQASLSRTRPSTENGGRQQARPNLSDDASGSPLRTCIREDLKKQTLRLEPIVSVTAETPSKVEKCARNLKLQTSQSRGWSTPHCFGDQRLILLLLLLRIPAMPSGSHARYQAERLRF